MIDLKPDKGLLLVADPSLTGDFSFSRSVVLLADHNESGSIGFILNKILDFTLDKLLPEVKNPFPVYKGGPVEQDNLFYVHHVPELIPDSVKISNEIYWGGNFEVVKTLIDQNRISENDIKFFLGYSGWDAQQLDNELEANAWILTSNEDSKKIIERPYSDIWKNKIKSLGGDYLIWANSPEHPSYN